MELAFAWQENPCRWFPRKVAALRYGPSTSWMSGVGTLPAVLTGSPTLGLSAFG